MTDRKKVIEDLQDAVNDDWMWQHADYYARTMEKAIQLLKEQDNYENCAIAIEDRQPVVRCKDCQYGYDCLLSCDVLYCILYDQRRSKEWFCADGERKEEKT